MPYFAVRRAPGDIVKLLGDLMLYRAIAKRGDRWGRLPAKRLGVRSRTCWSRQHHSTVQSVGASVRGSVTPTTRAVPAETDCTPS